MKLLFLLMTLLAEHHGVVRFGGLPLPGATVTASQGGKKVSTITDPQGAYRFPDLADGPWTVEVGMQLFAPERREIAVPASAEWDLQLLSTEEIAKAATTVAPAAAPTAPQPVARAKPGPAPTNTQTAFQRTELNRSAAASEPAAPGDAASQDSSELRQRAADGFLVNGSINNGAASPFSQLPAFGNNRRGLRSLYNGNLGLIVNNAAFDARSYSLTGQDTPKPAYSRLQGLVSFGGPIRIPRLLKRTAGNFTVNYQWTRNSNASTQTGLMPTVDQRNGILADRVIAPALISAQARALLALYPLPNFNGGDRYNYQVPIVGGLHQDDLQARAGRAIGRKDQVNGTFGGQSIRTDNTSLFGFLDTGHTKGITTAVNWRHSFNQRLFANLGYQYSRQETRTTPYFANRRNVSAEAGVAGNNQDALNWGPPALTFASGITALTDAQASFNRNQTSGMTFDMFYNRARHNLTSGGGFRRQQFNVLSQQDPRGTFTFTGISSGSDFASFLLGVPDTSSIAFGNADKYLRATNGEAWASDDWRINPSLTLNIGLRWEYWGPVSERYGRLVNLSLAPGFVAATPVVSGSPLQPDRNNLAPRLAFSWRPLAASSMVVRGGYGIYYDTSVYQAIALQMAQQAPLSKSLRVENSPSHPLSLANGFLTGGSTPTTFAVDPDFRLGYSQNWQLSLQRDLPRALQMTATYSGVKGTRLQQQILPNSFPIGAVNPCPTCPAGFTYLTSNGDSTREAAQIQVRRRLRAGLAAEVLYTYSRSYDNGNPGAGGRASGPIRAFTAQNWLDLRADHGRSSFDQRHVVTFNAQYTAGQGMFGGSLGNGRRATLLRDWTVGTQINAGTGFPLTPVYLAAAAGTGVTGTLRPDVTGAPLYDAPAGLHLNPAAFATPKAGTWGNAERNSITGPPQFTLNAFIGRTFQATDRISLDFRIDAANAPNHVTFPSWITTVNSPQFGLPVAANAMRSIQTTLRARF